MAGDRTDALTEEFYAWELRGRGWDIWPYHVDLEPPFRPFLGHGAHLALDAVDDGRQHTITSRWIERLSSIVRGQPNQPKGNALLLADEPAPLAHQVTDPYGELCMLAPRDFSLSREGSDALLFSLIAADPIAFEFVGWEGNARAQIAGPAAGLSALRARIEAFAPGVALSPSEETLADLWRNAGQYGAIVEFGLANEFILPLATRPPIDLLVPLVSALETAAADEVAVLQVLVARADAPWAASILRAAGNGAGGSFFADAPELLPFAKEKVSAPLVSCVIRAAASAASGERTLSIVSAIADALRHLMRPGANELVPLPNDGYPPEVHEADLRARSTMRGGMILSVPEVAALCHIPSSAVTSPRLIRRVRNTKPAPDIAIGGDLVLGANVAAGRTQIVALSERERTKHVYVIGASGTGKSTLLLSMIAQDLDAGRGVGLLDPHGDLIDDVLARIPAHRTRDVLLFDPSDRDHPVPFNILEAHSETERNLLASDLGAILQRLATSWGDQMTAVLGNALLAFLEGPGGTLLDLRRFLQDERFRREYLRSVSDPEIVSYWEHEFPRLSGRPEVSVLTRLNAFLRPQVMRNVVGHRENRIDFSGIMDSGKIFLAKLSGGLFGEENARLLGSLLVAKFHHVAIARQERAKEERRPFFLYVDEFQHFVTPSMASILSGARKYGLGLVLAHQELAQLAKTAEVGSAALTNACTRVCFRLGDADARRLADGFSAFSASDLSSLATGEAIVRIEQSSFDFNLKVIPPEPLDPEKASARRKEVIEHSREAYGASVPTTSSDTTQVSAPPQPGLASRTSVAERRGEVRPSLPPATPSSPGRGGREHKYLQQLVAKLAQDRGFRASIEHELPDGGRVDVALEGPVRIACEISVSTAPDHEVENIRKCLAAGFQEIAVIARDKRQLARMERHAGAALDEGSLGRVSFLAPEDVVELFDRAAESYEPAPTEVCGYRVRVKSSHATGDAEARRQAIARVVAASIRRIRDGRA